MKKNVWILNHYATSMFEDQGGRHYWFAKNLVEKGYSPVIFCSSTGHNSSRHYDTGDEKFLTKESDRIPFVFIKTPDYQGNGKKRIWNMVAFYRNLPAVAKEYAALNGKPDIILASSVHPLTLIAGIQLAKKFGISCICEIRDLWPESLVAYGSLKYDGFITKMLYTGEKWIYRKADKLIFTMEGGRDYIIERGWQSAVDLNKVHHINNGVDLEAYNANKKQSLVRDLDLEKKDCFKVVYAGAIRKVNNVGKLVEVAQLFKDKGINDIEFLIYGAGPDRETLEKYCKERDLVNVKFKGKVDKNVIPYVLSNSDLNFIHFQQNSIKKYGASLNKMFEYFASGKPTISDCEFGYDLIKRYDAGMVLDNADVHQLADGILKIKEMPDEEYANYARNAVQAAEKYDFKRLTVDLIDVIESKG